MALFMDVHTIAGGVSASDVADAHHKDLETQTRYGVSYLRYWVDESAGKIFCLVEAAARQRRAAGLVAALAGVIFSLGALTSAPATAQITDLPTGYQAGYADGWFTPVGSTVVPADENITAAPAPICSYTVGLPDGCWRAEPQVLAAGFDVDSTSNGLVPRNVR